ncbi:hybrid sensor histidine kinase/response regulator [Geminicoccus flavidas]|uniref:hybrid sensor histidine kinase/response regulator n=1 Tax=Geminicoccus flavidas TaxID=2506407 RepID=UPI001F1B3C31|nr:PAS domain-containing protein [Geminicoccus flavidas]
MRSLCGTLLDSLARSGQAVAVVDHRAAGSPLIFVNAAFEQLTGYRDHEVLGRDWRFLRSADADPAAIAALEAAVAEARPVTVELRDVRKNGEVFRDRLHITPIHDETGAAVFLLSMHSDVTVEPDRPESGSRPEALHEQPGVATEHARRAGTVSRASGGWEWDVPGRRLYADARFAELYGLAPGAAAGGLPTDTFFAPVHPADRMRLRIAVAGIMHGADIFAKEYRIINPDGSVRWVAARGSSRRGADHELLSFEGILTDITDQKRVEEQLRIVQTAGGVGTFEHVSGFGTVTVSDQFCRLLGLHACEALPVRTVNAVVHPDDPPLIGGQDDDSSYREFRVVHPETGEVRWLARRGEHRDEGHALGVRFIGAIYDVTAAKEAQEKLRQFAETLEARVRERTKERDRVWNNSRDLLAVVGEDGILRSVSPSWTEILGYRPDELAGRHAFELLHPDDVAMSQAAFRAAVHDHGLTDFETRLLHRDGTTRWTSWHTSHEDGLVFAYGRDITLEKARAEDLHRAEEQLRQAQKMEAIGQLTGGIAHDFNNLLQAVYGNLDLIRRKPQDSTRVGRWAENGLQAAERGVKLTAQLLAFSRAQRLELRPVAISALLRGMEDMLTRTLGPMVRATFDLLEGEHGVFADPTQLEMAVLNLAINARDAMPEGGHLTIETRLHSVVHDLELAPGGYLALRVIDDGIGMPPEVKARAFDPFFTTKDVGKGTGLGLSQVYGMVRQAGGATRIESTPGKGTAVTLLLRLAELASGAALSGEEGRADDTTAKAATVLVVDDDPDVRCFLANSLATLGYLVVEAKDGHTALQALDEANPDLMLVDFAMPGMNGAQVASIARTRRPDLPIVFASGYADTAEIDAVGMGTAVLRKPFRIEELEAAIVSALARD